jgi:hypothetical protein
MTAIHGTRVRCYPILNMRPVFNYKLKYLTPILFSTDFYKSMRNILGVLVEGPHTSVTPSPFTIFTDVIPLHFINYQYNENTIHHNYFIIQTIHLYINKQYTQYYILFAIKLSQLQHVSTLFGSSSGSADQLYV